MNKKVFVLLMLLWLALRGIASAYYDPTTKTFLSRDPIREAGGFNLYAYCENDPIGNFDPIGLAGSPLDQLDETIGKYELRLRRVGRKSQKTLDIANRRLDHLNNEVARIGGKLDAGLDAQFDGTAGEALQQMAIGAFDPLRSLFATPTSDKRPFWRAVMDGEYSLANTSPVSNPRLSGGLAGAELMGYGAMSLESRMGLPAMRYSGTDFMAQARFFQDQYKSVEAYAMATERSMWDAIEENVSTKPPLNTDLGNLWHYDQTNGGSGVGLPSALLKQYPNTTFQFTRRGVAGPDVLVTGGMHPSEYPGSIWKAGNYFGDFKPSSDSGVEQFLRDMESGKLPPNTQYIPYDSDTGNLGL